MVRRHHSVLPYGRDRPSRPSRHGGAGRHDGRDRLRRESQVRGCRRDHGDHEGEVLGGDGLNLAVGVGVDPRLIAAEEARRRVGEEGRRSLAVGRGFELQD